MATATSEGGPSWRFERRPWGRADLIALGVWTAAVVAYFWKAATLQEALFYFDITEINYPYRDFLARELRAGRFSRWHPGLYCGLPLYSESQAGYLHPFKYLLYPWLETWQAFNLDTILSVWLTGAGAYGWLRRHVGPSGALTGASVFGLSGYVWAHLIHTSMINALASVPLLFWALESAWEGGGLRPVVLGGLAMACQVFAGHNQDTILTGGALGLYTLYRASTDRGRGSRASTLGLSAGLAILGLLISAVQWVPSKELLDRSPRAGGLSWAEQTYGSWHPELLPTLIVREAYGTRARDTDWMDGYYPYHEMNSYMGLIAIGLAIVGGAAYRDRWVAFWVLLAGIGGILMLGRYSILLDHAHRLPVLGSARIPVRFHLWVSLAVAALSAVGVDRLSRPGPVRWRGAVLTLSLLVLASIPILAYVYAPVWTEPNRWNKPYHLARYHWLGRELTIATARTASLAMAAWALAVLAARTGSPARRARLAAAWPLLLIVDLLGAHIADVPTIDPSYWTEPPESARLLAADPACVRIFGAATYSSGEPGYASEPVDFQTVRDRLAWSLPPVWGLKSSWGETPLISRRCSAFANNVPAYYGRFALQGVTHIVAGTELASRLGPGRPAGSAFIYRNEGALPRVRLMGRPIYVGREVDAVASIASLGDGWFRSLLIEDPDRPLPGDAEASGTARIVREVPERVEVAVDAAKPAYLVMSDTFDPGWTARLDGEEVPIRPAWITFRAVFVPPGRHELVFQYRPAGFALGLTLTSLGLAIALVAFARPTVRLGPPTRPEHDPMGGSRTWPAWFLMGLLLLVLASIFEPTAPSASGPAIRDRWRNSFHPFTWGAGIHAMHVRPPSS